MKKKSQALLPNSLLLVRLLLVFGTAAFALTAQTPSLPGTPAPAVSPMAAGPSDALNRLNPRDTVRAFLHACQTGNYLRATEYMDLHELPQRSRKRDGMELALKLSEILQRDGEFEISKLSDAPEGAPGDLPRRNLELIDTVPVDKKQVQIELQRTALNPTTQIWLFSAGTVDMISSLHTVIGESDFEKHLPSVLVSTTFIDTSLWRWLALLIAVPVLGYLGRIISKLLLTVLRRAMGEKRFHYVARLWDLLGPATLLVSVIAYSAFVALVGPSAQVRFLISRVLILLAFIAIAWFCMRLLDILAARLHFFADPRQAALFSSILPLALRVAKVGIFMIAVISAMSAWGYNTNTIWATLGVGSLAVALAAQKTLENFFGGVSVIGDRPVLVGDFCRVDNQVGTVEDIGLRSTRIRTLDRTVLTVPNSQFSTMTLENFAKRDKMWFHPTFNLRIDSTPAQLRQVMTNFTEVLRNHELVEIGDVPIRFTGVTEYAFTLEIFAYVSTPNFDLFLATQSELLLRLLEAVEKAGTALAVPVRAVSGFDQALDAATGLPKQFLPASNGER